MFEITRYTPDKAEEWNSFVAESKNGTFLFDRNYMDYHHDRFADHSFMFYLKNRLYALLPANSDGTCLYSHQGLTYGGLITDRSATAEGVCTLFRELGERLREEGFRRVVYKAMPWIYHRIPAEEDLYALTNVCHARLANRDISSAIMAESRLRFGELRRRGAKKAMRQGIVVEETDDTSAFWKILDDNLEHKYGVHPVHTEAELRLLKSRFPRLIRIFMARKDDRWLGGTLVFVTPQVVHTQYISASPEGKKEGALDLVFDRLINDTFARCRCFDFGKSTEDGGRYLNTGLIFQKEGFGGRGVCYDAYEWTIE